jgi:hypothetical protein
MARYQIMYWKDFPTQIKAVDDDGSTAKAMLPSRFSEAVDLAAMAEGSTDSADYLDGWDWGEEQEHAGSAQEVVDTVLATLDTEYSPERLKEMIKQYRAK